MSAVTTTQAIEPKYFIFNNFGRGAVLHIIDDKGKQDTVILDSIDVIRRTMSIQRPSGNLEDLPIDKCKIFQSIDMSLAIATANK